MSEQPKQRHCGTMPVHERLLRSNPQYARARNESENRLFEYRTGQRSLARTGVTVIPVVVHVVHNKDHAEQNISDDQVKSQIDVLNQDFRKLNPDAATTPTPFLPLVADARIEFALADKDPSGNPTNGITRTKTTSASFVDDDLVKSAGSGGADAWPADKYLNLWCCPLGNNLLGYAQFPGGPAATDGVVILHSAFGNTGTAAPPFDKGRTATHEIGHWLNLRHIWGDDGTGCSGVDFVDDTPNQASENTGRPAFPHVTCSNGPNGDMFMNYMDYTDDAGMFMFTAGQVLRMQATLDQERSALGTVKSVVTIAVSDLATLATADNITIAISDVNTIAAADNITTAVADNITIAASDINTLAAADTITTPVSDNITLATTDATTQKFRDDPITLKFRDDFQTIKARDDLQTLKFMDDPITLKFRDDPATLKFRDDLQTVTVLDLQTNPNIDNVVKSPGSDIPGLPQNPGNPGGRGGASPFILSTGHHSMAWKGSYPDAAARSVADLEELLPQYERAIEEINQAHEQGQLTQADMEYAERIESEYSQLFGEYRSLTSGNG